MKSLLHVRPVSRGPVSVSRPKRCLTWQALLPDLIRRFSRRRQFPVPAEGRSPGLRIITLGRLPGLPVAYPASDSPEYSDEFVQDSHLFPFSPEHMQDAYLRHLPRCLIESMCRFYHICIWSTTSVEYQTFPSRTLSSLFSAIFFSFHRSGISVGLSCIL